MRKKLPVEFVLRQIAHSKFKVLYQQQPREGAPSLMFMEDVHFEESQQKRRFQQLQGDDSIYVFALLDPVSSLFKVVLIDKEDGSFNFSAEDGAEDESESLERVAQSAKIAQIADDVGRRIEDSSIQHVEEMLAAIPEGSEKQVLSVLSSAQLPLLKLESAKKGAKGKSIQLGGRSDLGPTFPCKEPISVTATVVGFKDVGRGQITLSITQISGAPSITRLLKVGQTLEAKVSEYREDGVDLKCIFARLQAQPVELEMLGLYIFKKQELSLEILDVKNWDDIKAKERPVQELLFK